MALTIGLDFGTHQTKVCIEDASDPLNKRYEFFEFELKGVPSFVYPSLVQINKDGRLSYGALESENALECFTSNYSRVEFQFPDFIPRPKPQAPKFESLPIPPEKKRKTNDLRNILTLFRQNGLEDEHEKRCNEIKARNQILADTHRSQCKEHEVSEERRLEEWKKSKEIALANFEITQNSTLDQIGIYQFRYFKTAALGDNRYWQFNDIDPKDISVLFLCNILFQVESHTGKEAVVQMGIPQTLGDRRGEAHAMAGIRMLYAARKLMELFDSHQEFLETEFDLLKSLIERPSNIDAETRYREGIEVLPEAYAGLLALTNQKAIPRGFNLLVDIGGGTTDVALFTINSNGNKPDIAKVLTVNGGLNGVLKSLNGLDVEDIQLFLSRSIVTEQGKTSQHVFSEGIRKEINKLIQELYNEFNSQGLGTRLGTEALNEALANRKVYYAGGGGVFKEFRQPIGTFQDVAQVTLQQLRIPGVTHDKIKSPFDTILAVSYGLSISNDSIDPPVCTPIAGLLQPLIDKSQRDTDYTRDYND